MHKILKLVTEIIGWIQIALSPTFFGLIIGFIVYNNFENIYGLIIGIIIALLGLIFGIILATKKFKTSGTIHFLSRVSATPELDKDEEKENKTSR
jgi:hypothetical protein